MQRSIKLYLQAEFPHIVAKESSRSKRFSLRFNPSRRHFVLTIPPFSGIHRLKQFLNDSAQWTQKILDSNDPQKTATPSEITILGQKLNIVYEEKKTSHLWQSDDSLYLRAPFQKKSRALESWLRQRAFNHFSHLATTFCLKIDASFSKLSIKDTRTRWGSCTHKKALNFSWRLLLAPPEISFYVCAHEVAHLKEMNHGPAFWRLVSILDPNHHAARKWLKEQGCSLFSIQFDNL